MVSSELHVHRIDEILIWKVGRFSMLEFPAVFISKMEKATGIAGPAEEL